jgi:DNA-binding SARP family transcriptional activator
MVPELLLVTSKTGVKSASENTAEARFSGIEGTGSCTFPRRPLLVEAFEQNLSEPERLKDEAPEQAIGHLQKATSLYRGDFLEDLAYSEWAMVRQEELQRTCGDALLLLGRLLLAQNRHAEAAEACRKAISHDELVKEAHRELMRCYAAVGERGRALRHYEDLGGSLEEQLGTSPAPETSALYRRQGAGEEF